MAGGAAPAEAEVEVPSKDALEAVTMATQSFFIAHERAPKSLEELVSSGYLRKLPAPPAGKKYVYDAANANISLADQ
jgi:competence protein ComGC